MIEVGTHSKIKVKWNVSPYDFSKEKLNSLIAKFSSKYKIPKSNIRIETNFQTINEKGQNISVTNDVISNIQDPSFQLKLFCEFLELNQIHDCDFDLIKQIDSEINASIDYDVYDKYRKYSLKWVEWSNFLSYGEGNRFDFTQLKDMVLLNGEPANQSGKTTFAIDLIHFLLYGKTDKSPVLEKVFNKHLKEATEVLVKGCLNIDGVDYVIKRKLTRPAYNKRTERSKTVQKVEYFKIVGDSLEELVDYTEEHGENTAQTNKIIREAIGSENDFDMIICATSSNLDDLIEKKETERGRLLSRWIGLLPIEQKDILAREKFNGSIKPTLISNHYNVETLSQEIKAYKTNIFTLKGNVASLVKENESLTKEIESLENLKNTLLLSKTHIDDSLLKVDIHSLNQRMNDILEKGKIKKNELDDVVNELKTLEDIDFSINEYDALIEKHKTIYSSLIETRLEFRALNNQIKALKESEYCPTCGRKYDNIDNSFKINELLQQSDKLKNDGILLAQNEEKLKASIESLKNKRELYERKSKLIVKESALQLNVEQLRNQYKEFKQILVEYNKNNEAIDKNNKLDIQLRNTEVNLRTKRQTKETNISYIEKNHHEIESYLKCISERNDLIQRINEETKLIKHWRIYLDMVGRNGISKMVLRKTLPIINAQLSHMLMDVCDFDVEITINDKNDVQFYLVKDGVKSDLTSGSGFEKTASALALRAILGQISTLPKINGLILDEIWGRVAKENYDNLKQLLDKIKQNYDYIIIISHLDEIKEYCDTIITVIKENNISRITVINKERNNRSLTI